MGTAVVGLAAYGAAGAVGSLAGGDTTGANIGLGIAVLGLRLAATPPACWWLLRRAHVPRAGLATVFGTVGYLLLAPVAGSGDPATPVLGAVWAVLGGIAGALGVYAAGLFIPRDPAARA
ncbi:hypothetical protein LP52_01795 [Streptomonospora alba]|uniref:Uncharacterized protein n=1 Tax=Streptomonospora alba TaxID=183763 RepID=A0A0C2JTS1_9ACTN|nr:hypothetical protein LP52_01795 [Streptomonospora alba]